MIRWCSPVMDEEMISAAKDALVNEKLVMGESVHKFEEEFAKYCGTAHAISTSSGTNALFFAFIGLGIQNKKVATAASSFVATPNSIIHSGNTPVFIDVNNEYTLDTDDLKKLRENIAAVLPVHLYGNPAKMNEILEVSEGRGIPVIEDACQAHGADYHGKKCGGIGTVGCFSFYSTKNLTVGGDGGMITTNDDKLAGTLSKLRDCGRISQYEHDMIGYTARLNNVNAAIGRVQLKKLPQWNEKRRELAREYAKLLDGVADVTLPNMPTTEVKPVYHLFSILHPQRDKLKVFLKEKGIDTGTNYPVPLHLQRIYKKLYGYQVGDFPMSERLSKSVLCLPMHVNLSKDDVKKVCEAIIQFGA